MAKTRGNGFHVGEQFNPECRFAHDQPSAPVCVFPYVKSIGLVTHESALPEQRLLKVIRQSFTPMVKSFRGAREHNLCIMHQVKNSASIHFDFSFSERSAVCLWFIFHAIGNILYASNLSSDPTQLTLCRILNSLYVDLQFRCIKESSC